MPKQASRAHFLVFLLLITGSLLAFGALFYALTPSSHRCNTGTAFSWQGLPSSIVPILSLAGLLLGLFWVYTKHAYFSIMNALGWLLFLGGGLSNTIERLLWHCVHDSLPLGFGLINNPADWSIAIGGLLLVVYYGSQKSR